MKTELIVLSSRNIAEVSFPAYSRKEGGSCDFMSVECRKHCKLSSVAWEKKALELFEDKPTSWIIRKIIEEMEATKATVIGWFIGSGDCPRRMTIKLSDIISDLSELGYKQNGFTRNVDFWKLTNRCENVRMALTIESTTYDSTWQSHKGWLIARPQYDKLIVNIEIIGYYSGGGCGAGWYRPSNEKDEPFVEDCSLCLKHNRGCWTIIK